ncbi:hypothetical protein NVV43_28510, partial [Escherichia marmotae]|nr:hypothetical protein [Escherichia marmotae]
NGIINEAKEQLEKNRSIDPDFIKKEKFLNSVIISCEAAITYVNRYAKKAKEIADNTSDAKRKAELNEIAKICSKVSGEGAKS